MYPRSSGIPRFSLINSNSALLYAALAAGLMFPRLLMSRRNAGSNVPLNVSVSLYVYAVEMYLIGFWSVLAPKSASWSENALGSAT